LTEPPTKDELLGATALVGLRYHQADGTVHRTQVFGVIQSIGESTIDVLQRDGSTFTLPPAIEAFGRAEPGLYRNRGTGEEVLDPDFTAAFDVYPPEDEKGDLPLA
jgi:hypothetical protein